MSWLEAMGGVVDCGFLPSVRVCSGVLAEWAKAPSHDSH